MKLQDIVIYQANENPSDFGEKLLKVKVTVAKILVNFYKIRFPDNNSKSLYPIQIKLQNIVKYQARENTIDLGENSFQVKVTVAKILRKFCKNKVSGQ